MRFCSKGLLAKGYRSTRRAACRAPRDSADLNLVWAPAYPALPVLRAREVPADRTPCSYRREGRAEDSVGQEACSAAVVEEDAAAGPVVAAEAFVYSAKT